MKTRLTLLLIAFLIGGPVMAEQVHSISAGILVFAWMLGMWAPNIKLGRRAPDA